MPSKKKPERGRSIKKSIFVELDEGEYERYRALAEELGLTMRALVRQGLDAMVRERNTARLDPRIEAGLPAGAFPPPLPRGDVDLRVRVSQLEEFVIGAEIHRAKYDAWAMAIGSRLGILP